MAQNGTRSAGPRCVALVGPFQSGKTTLLEAIMARTGAVQRQGTIEAGTTVGDASKEARHHKMSVELSVATTSFMGDTYTFIDCPGSVEFVHDMRAALPVVDAAVVVCEMDDKKIPQLQLILRELEDQNIPRFLFLNKIDKVDSGVHDALALLQPASRKKLLLRQIPTFKGDLITGFVDLALERAFVYKEHAASEVVPLEGDSLDKEKTARFSMLETLADHDDELMEQLLEDIQPPKDKVFDDLARELREGLVCPVLLGSAARTNGVLRLMKALRHEAPNVEATIKRLGIKAGSEAVGYVLKTLNTAHSGKMSVVRVLAGQIGDSTTLSSPEREVGRVAGTFKLMGQHTEKRGPATVGETVALAKLDYAKTGDTLSTGKQAHTAIVVVRPYPAVLATAVAAKERKDDVKLGQALNSCWRKIPRSRWCITPKPTRSCSGARAKCICVSRANGSPTVMACRSRAAGRPLATARPSRKASSSAAATRSNPAATASSAMSCSISSRCRAARASSSRTRSAAVSCRAITSPRSRKASSTRSSTARSAFRSSTSMSR